MHALSTFITQYPRFRSLQHARRPLLCYVRLQPATVMETEYLFGKEGPDFLIREDDFVHGVLLAFEVGRVREVL